MNYRTLGRTGLTVSEIGFGTWGLGGNSYGPVDDAVSIAALQTAYDAGITFYDTSDLYGNGHSEEILRQALSPVRDKIVICTKVGLLPHSGFDMPCDFSAEHIREGLEGSLRRLRTDYIDLYLLHSPTLDLLSEEGEVVATMQQLQAAGKIRSYGISARSPGDAHAAISRFDFAAAQVNFNLIDQRAIENGLLHMAQEKNAGIIARTPLCFGYLTGKLTGAERFSDLDHRRLWPEEQVKRWAKAPDLFAFLNAEKDRTPSQFALRFCLDHAGISTIIPGMMNPDEVRENVQATELASLDEAELGRIKLIYQANSFYDSSIKNSGTVPAREGN